MSGAENLQCVPEREFLARWRIKNASMFGIKENQSEISPTFKVPFLGNTKWYLKLLFRRPGERDIRCFLWRNTDDEGPEYVKVYYSILVGSSYSADFQTFSKNSSSFLPGLIDQDEFHEKVFRGNSKDVLQIECRLWPDSGTEVLIPTSPYPVGIEMVTTIQKETRSIFQKIPNFSKIQVGKVIEFHLDSAESADSVPKLICGLWMEQQTTKVLKVLLHEAADNLQFDFMLKCNVRLLDAFGVRYSLYHGSAVFHKRLTNTMNVQFALSNEQLMEKKDLYLPGDELLLHWEFAYTSNKNIASFVERTLYDETSDLQVKRELKWEIYLERKYNEHRLFFRLLAILTVVLSVLPHLLYDNTL
ncbi:hypothetical protein JTE90_026823 [Oedothorax gibbosus]|uniref:MATH domain-containing protein n=1 Tax=Oedothorax gibbosus TaxID=931172 RepID=A0AAV6V7D6_9ARAC|nr:hypothetical protein JTE90_026823 [Oedothorax gibbosus]